MDIEKYLFLLNNNGAGLDLDIIKALGEIGIIGLVKHSFLHSMDVSGVAYRECLDLYRFLGVRDFNSISKLVGINITCKILTGNGYHTAGTNNAGLVGRLNVVLINNRHYAIDRFLPFTPYSLVNHEELEVIGGWNRVSGVRCGMYRRNSRDFGISTLEFFKILGDAPP